MKALKRIAVFAGSGAALIIAVGFVKIVLELNAKWMTVAFWILLILWVVAESVRYIVVMYRRLRLTPSK